MGTGTKVTPGTPATTTPSVDAVPEQNRVTPFGEIVAIDQRGTFLGNRGVIHRGRQIVRRWRTRAWITCRLDNEKGHAPMWEPGRWTALFFFDEAVALAAGHRPCAFCRHAAFIAWLDAWERATGERPRAAPLDVALHSDRVGPDGRQRRHEARWAGLPDGTFVADHGAALLVDGGRLLRWSPVAERYEPVGRRPVTGTVEVLTPAATVAVLAAGYRPTVHPSAH